MPTKEFKLSSLCSKVERGTRLIKQNRQPGKIPLITAGYEKAGISEYINNSENKTYKDCITIDMFGNCFYRDYEFKADDNILILSTPFSDLVNLYLCVAINKVTQSYNYGKQYRLNSFKNTIISLPVLYDGSPNYNFMENYIRAIEKQVIQQYNRDKLTHIQTTKELIETTI